MAQVSVPLQVPPSPAAGMSRRAPLSNLPNAVNSPVQGPVAAKRSRSQSAVQREPPSKKQATESTVLRTPRRSHAPTVNDVERKATNNAAKKIVARKRPTQSAVPPPTFADINAQKNQQNVVTAWKKHYKKVFPTFVFYFDSVPADVIGEAKKHLNHLGAACEEFFSRRVTHVVTGRDLSGEDATKKSTKGPREIGSLSRKVGKGQEELGNRNGKDILNKAKEYEMRVWGIEKLEKVLNGLQDFPPGAPCLTNPRAISAHRQGENIDISKVLREDKDPKASHELHYFKGPYIYVHDMFETHRPMLVKEWPKPQNGELGLWPQLHSVRDNKCPFVPASSEDREEDRRREAERRDREKARLQKMQYEVNQALQKRLAQTQSKPAAVTTTSKSTAKPEDVRTRKTSSRNAPAEIAQQEPLKEVKNVAEEVQAVRPSVKAVAPPLQKATRPRLEPVASGIQPSNITSAIRSQMVSSHQDAPGQRAGMSKEIYALKRKAADNMLARAPVQPKNAAVSRSKGADSQIPRHAQKAEQVQRKKPLPYAQEAVLLKPERKVMKPGYCENCHVKFDDFDEHIQSRKHRKFALDDSNWAELDQLMAKLIRPLKDTVL